MQPKISVRVSRPIARCGDDNILKKSTAIKGVLPLFNTPSSLTKQSRSTCEVASRESWSRRGTHSPDPTHSWSFSQSLLTHSLSAKEGKSRGLTERLLSQHSKSVCWFKSQTAASQGLCRQQRMAPAAMWKSWIEFLGPGFSLPQSLVLPSQFAHVRFLSPPSIALSRERASERVRASNWQGASGNMVSWLAWAQCFLISHHTVGSLTITF